jgi:hypothetical protein
MLKKGKQEEKVKGEEDKEKKNSKRILHYY